MSGAVIGTRPCTECDGTVRYSENKSGGISGSCDSCKAQFFHRSPKAVEGLKRNIAGAKKGNGSAGDPADPPAKGEAFDYSKL